MGRDLLRVLGALKLLLELLCPEAQRSLIPKHCFLQCPDFAQMSPETFTRVSEGMKKGQGHRPGKAGLEWLGEATVPQK